ncbi:MAG: hypothetical protein WD830_07640 [Chloroflexota bacterium]
MAELSVLLSILASLAVTIGVIGALVQLRDFRKQQQEEIAIRLMSHFGDDSFIAAFWRVQDWDFKSIEDFEARATKADWIAWYAAGSFFELMGLLYKRGLASLELLDDLLSNPVLSFWNAAAVVTTGYRVKYEAPQILQWLEVLARAMDQRLTELGERHPPFREGWKPPLGGAADDAGG